MPKKQYTNDQQDRVQNETQTPTSNETLNPNKDLAEESVLIRGGGDPNLFPDAGKPLI